MAPFLDLEHVFDAQKGFLRPLVEGRLAVPNIVKIGVRGRRDNEVHVEAIVVRSTNIKKEPVTVNICISNGEPAVDKRIKEISCSCPAGACKKHCCKHAMAVIIYLERNDESQIEVLTCTDTLQMWGKVKDNAMRMFDPVPLSEFCHFPKTLPVYQREVKEFSEEMSNRFKNMFLQDLPNSEASLFWSGQREPAAPKPTLQQARPSQRLVNFFRHIVSNQNYLLKKIQQLSKELLEKCSPAEKRYYAENVVVTQDEALRIFLDSQGQCNEIWDAARFGRITGSTSYQCFTYHVNKNPDWDRKLEGLLEGTFINSAMEESFYEPFALKKYIEEGKQQCGSIDCMEVGIVINPLLPWLGFSADSVILKDHVPVVLWENKTPVKGKSVHASEISKCVVYCDKESGKLKHLNSYYGQVQLGMFLLDLPACDFCIYCTGPVAQKYAVPDFNLESIHIERIAINEAFCSEYLERLCHVYFEKMLPWLTNKSQ